MKFNIFVVLIHIIGWILFLSLPVIFLGGDSNNINFQTFFFSAPYLAYILIYGGIFYLHNYVLFPLVYLHGHKLFYFIILLLLGMGVLIIKPFDNVMKLRRDNFSVPAPPVDGPFQSDGRPENIPHYPPPGGQDARPDRFHPPGNRHPPLPGGNDFFNPPFNSHPDIIAFFLYLLFITMGVLIEGSRKLQRTQQQLLRTESEKSKAELTFLKAQINPHFIFNTLNNIYSLAESGEKETPEAILKLSGIMRYIVDDTNDMFVPLANEIECINDYIYLQRLRLGQYTHLQYVLEGSPGNQRIAPLLLISFIENVFNYGISNREYSPVAIHLEIQHDTLVFTTENNIFRDGSATGSGLGISNTRKRLDLMYAGKYQLDIRTEDNIFKVRLVLKLTE
jgi:hypothetical protein